MINVKYQDETKQIMPFTSYEVFLDEVKKEFGINEDTNVKLKNTTEQRVEYYLDSANYEDFLKSCENRKSIEIIISEGDNSIEQFISQKEIGEILHNNFKDLDKLVNESVLEYSRISASQIPKMPSNEELNKKKTMSKVYHPNYSCNKCGTIGITGIRFRCPVCQKFDLCEQCEQSFGANHIHPLMKLVYPIS